MNKKKVQVRLDTGEVTNLTALEIKHILRAADPIIASGGRNMLAKILKGSKDKKLFAYKLDTCPSYGAFQELTLNKIMEYIDFAIQEGYLDIAYNAKLPMLVYTERGWLLEKETYAEELIDCILSNSNKEDILEVLKTTNREVKLLMLEKIENSNNRVYESFLEMWKTNEVKKMKTAIQRTLNTIT